MSLDNHFVHVNEATLIKPSHPTPNHILNLSKLDSQSFVRFTFEYLLVYKHKHGLHKSTTLANLKSALSQALVPYYPLAGRVRKQADGLGLEVVCRAQGAIFIEASSQSTVSEFDSPPKRVAHRRKFLSVHAPDVLKGVPPLVIQLTWLSDGGATLAVGFNHCLCDGIGSGQFLNSFAELARGTSRLGELKPSPTWCRHFLDGEAVASESTTRVDSQSHPEFKAVPDISGFTTRYAQERLIPTSIIFNKTELDRVKRQLKSPCTTFEVISAHAWRSWAKSLNMPSNQIVKLVFSINIRKRVKPSVPNGYYGNAFVLGCAQTSVRDLTGSDLDHAVNLIKHAKDRVGNEYVKEVIEAVSSKGASVDSVGVMVLTQWSRLGLENVDFGIGKPVQVGPVCCDKYCLLLPVPNKKDAVKVNLAVPESAVDRYLRDLTNTCCCH